MTSATMRRDRGARQGEGYWMIVFAVALLVTVGFFNLIDGIAAIANSHVFIANAHYVVGDLRAWGWVVLILGVLQVIAALAILAGSQAYVPVCWCHYAIVSVVVTVCVPQAKLISAELSDFFFKAIVNSSTGAVL